MTAALLEVKFTPNVAADVAHWKASDPAKIKRIKALINNIQDKPFEGIGKPEPLKHDLQGCWSRRINREHRLVYKVEDDTLIILAARYHYR